MAQTGELDGAGSPRQPAADPLIGESLLHYKVIEIIGQGGMSVVYRGHDEHLHRDVAIKVLHPFLAEKPECRLRLAREARAVARLEHPHILKVFDFSGDPTTLDDVDDNEPRTRVKGFAEGFIIAELVRGGTLKRVVEKHRLWRCPELGAMVVWQIASALQHAHDHGVVHRDIKPENIMVREDGWLKLMDFGIAHVADQQGLTITGTLLGSPAHMAPECIDGYTADERSDLFALGTILYWIATGSLPFEAPTPHALLKQIADGRAIPAQQRSPRVSDELARIIAKAMATKPADRYPSASAFAQALQELLERSGVPAEPERLRRALAQPDAEIIELSRQVRRAHLQRAEQLLGDAQPARALACLSRVLADDKDDVDARALLERAQDVIALAPPVATPTIAIATARVESLREPFPWARIARQASVAAAAALLIAAAVLIAVRFDDAAPIAVTMPALEEGTSTGQPAGLEPPPVTVPLEGKGPVVATVDEAGRDATVGKVVALEGVRPPRVKEPVIAKRKVTLWARPWADIYVDGVKAASFTKKAEVEMAVGAHVVTFKATGARDVEVKLDVSAAGPINDVKVELAPQPAYLVIESSNAPDAFVQVNGQGSKQVKQTWDRPISVRLTSSKQTLEVTIYQKGYVLLVRKVTFVAGETFRLKDVVLEREANEGTP